MGKISISFSSFTFSDNFTIHLVQQKIQIDKTHVFVSSLSHKCLNFIDRNLKTCKCLKDEFFLTNTEKFKLFQIIYALPKQWRELVAMYDGNLSNHNLV